MLPTPRALAIASSLFVLVTSRASAQAPTAQSASLSVGTSLPTVATPQTSRAADPFARRFAFGGYATGQAGSYFGWGVGGRARWEPYRRLGFEVYLEAVAVHTDAGSVRRDMPNGFNLYVPFQRGRARIRPYAGFCDVLSFLRPTRAGAPRANDVLIGVHLGLGGELAVRPRASVFVDVQTNLYAGHGRTAQGWTGGVDGSFAFFWNAQLNLGVQLHAGR